MDNKEAIQSHIRSTSISETTNTPKKALGPLHNINQQIKRNKHIMATHKRNRSDVFQNNIITSQKLLESPRAKITFNPKMSGHRRSSSLQVNKNQDIQSALSNGNKTKQGNRLSINFNNNNINTNQLHKNLMQSPSTQFMHNTLSSSNNNITINTLKKTSQNDVMYISPMVSLFNKKDGNNGEIFQQKKSAHRRASSLSVKGLDPLELSNHNNNNHNNMYNSKKVPIGKTSAKKGRVSSEDNFSIDEMIDNKHKKLLSDGIITPPDLTSPISSPNTSSFLLNFKKNGNNNTNKSTNKVINISLGSPVINRIHPHQQDGFVHPDLLSTDFDIEEEFEFSYDDDDSSNRNKGRFAPNPFKMISGGDFDFGSPPRYGCISAPTVNYNTFVVSDIEPHEIGEDYFQRKRSNSLNGSQDDLILTESSAFKTFFDDN